MHPSPRELQQLLSEARSLELGSPRQLQLLESLRAHCPAFLPALLLSGRAELWGKEEVGSSEAFFDAVERMLRDAVETSGREPAALVALARFMSVVRDSPQDAEALYREASTRALAVLEEAWAGLIEALGEQEKLDEAAHTARSARQVFPESRQLSEACDFAKLGG
jgi:hypothetical protein